MLKYDMLEQAKRYIWMFVDRPCAAAMCFSKSQLSVSTGLYAQTVCLEQQVDCRNDKFHKICRGRLAMYQAMDAVDTAECMTPAGICGCWCESVPFLCFASSQLLLFFR